MVVAQVYNNSKRAGKKPTLMLEVYSVDSSCYYSIRLIGTILV